VDQRVKKVHGAAVSLLVICLALLILCSENNSGQGGPLLFQVHFASPLKNLKLVEAKKILSGTSFQERGLISRLKIYGDRKILPLLKKKHPLLKACSLPDKPPASQRDVLVISGPSGLVPSMKLLTLEGHYPWGKTSPRYKTSKTENYPLRLPGIAPWEPEEHSSVVQTGVTAMTRAFTRTVERHGDQRRPLAQVRDITADADLAITSNEVSFTSPCTWPLKNRMLFCSPEKYFSILTRAGFDVIELTGNHNNDYGTKPALQTIRMIKENRMHYFGGGRNKKDAFAVKKVTVGKTVFAFLGFNQWGPPMAWAGRNKPGAARLSRRAFIEGIKKAASVGDIVFLTVQWGNENNPVPHREQIEYFHLAAKLGANIMVSSSAHRAMGVEFFEGKFISYGLGNFLFDQMQTVNHRRGMIARHHFYKKRHIETELIPYLIYNHSEPRIVSGHQASDLFRYVFRYSRGPVFKRR